MKLFFWIIFVFLCLTVGSYPLAYVLVGGKFGILQSKSATLLTSSWWSLGFYVHIVTGGIALFLGWSQFIKSWRKRNPRLHRNLGKIYVIMACVSSLAAVCIAPQSSTGWIAGLGFGTLGVVWFCVTLLAYTSIRGKDFPRHERLMVYSYSACCAAITLRLWLPLLLGVFRFEFALAYPMVAWLCWVPNLLIAHFALSRLTSGATERFKADD